jgi:hypothetical protein
MKFSGWRCVGVGLALLFVSAMPVRAEEEKFPLCPPPDTDALLMNPAGDPVKRQASLEELIAISAKSGNHSFRRHELGSLYRLGRNHPAKMVDRDLQKAYLLLSNAALEGELMAMAGVAEIKLKEGDAMSAMVWAQSYIHFLRELEPSLAKTSEPHMADLLNRIYRRIDRSPESAQEITQYVAAFVATHGEKIRENHGWTLPSGEGPMCQHASTLWPLRRIADADDSRLRNNRAARKLRSPGLVDYQLWVSPEGKVVHALVIDSLPDERTALGLQATIEQMRFNKVDAEAPLRVTRLVVPYNDAMTSLRN